LSFRNLDGEEEKFDPEEAMERWDFTDDDKVVWKIARGRYVLFHVVYSEPEKAVEVMEPLLGQELTHSEAQALFANHPSGHTPDEPATLDPAESDPPPRENRQSPPPKAAGNPLNETLESIPRATHGLRLIQHLFEQPGRSAKLRDVCKLVYKSIDKGSLHKMAKVIRETRIALEKRDAPLRLAWDSKAKIVSLISRDGP
jgi:hypothetical protein